MQDETLKKERQFHDAWASTIDIDGIRVNDYFEACTAPENRFILNQMGDITGKRLLDLGCGAGENSVYFAKKGANCVAADYSQGMVEVALKLAEKNGVKIDGCTVNAMEMDFPDNSFDIVYASNLLHHLPEPEKAIREMHRVLKPGGKACFWDPMKHNPVINVYRRMATKVRTEDESPLDINIVNCVKSLFSETAYDTFWLTALWIFLRFYRCFFNIKHSFCDWRLPGAPGGAVREFPWSRALPGPPGPGAGCIEVLQNSQTNECKACHKKCPIPG